MFSICLSHTHSMDRPEPDLLAFTVSTTDMGCHKIADLTMFSVCLSHIHSMDRPGTGSSRFHCIYCRYGMPQLKKKRVNTGGADASSSGEVARIKAVMETIIGELTHEFL